MKYFCEKCGRKILKREIPWCELHRVEEYNRLKRSAQKIKTKVKNNKMIKKIFKLQDEPKTPEADAPETPEETPSEGTPTGEEKKEDEE